jgi:hypothetical protein
VFVMLDAAAPTRLFSSLPEGVTIERREPGRGDRGHRAYLRVIDHAPDVEAGSAGPSSTLASIRRPSP